MTDAPRDVASELNGHVPAPGAPADYDGWNPPKPDHVPPRTTWPAAAALGTVMIFWGVVTSYLILGVGVGLLALSVVGWIKDTLRDGVSHE